LYVELDGDVVVQIVLTLLSTPKLIV